MRKGLILLLVCVWAVPVLAQTESPWREGNKVRAYVRPALKIFEIEDATRILVGGRIAWVSRHNFGFGPEAYTLVGNREVGHQGIFSENILMNHYFKMVYGGINIEYIYALSRIFHLSADLHSGTGVMKIDVAFEGGNTIEARREAFYVFEPAVNFIMKVSRFSWLEAGVGYRFVRGLDRRTAPDGIDDTKLSAWVAAFALRFGRM